MTIQQENGIRLHDDILRREHDQKIRHLRARAEAAQRVVEESNQRRFRELVARHQSLVCEVLEPGSPGEFVCESAADFVRSIRGGRSRHVVTESDASDSDSKSFLRAITTKAIK